MVSLVFGVFLDHGSCVDGYKANSIVTGAFYLVLDGVDLILGESGGEGERVDGFEVYYFLGFVEGEFLGLADIWVVGSGWIWGKEGDAEYAFGSERALDDELCEGKGELILSYHLIILAANLLFELTLISSHLKIITYLLFLSK